MPRRSPRSSGSIDLLAALEQLTTALGCELLRRHATDEVGVEVAAVEPQGSLDELLGLAVLRPDDHVLGDVDQAPCEVAGVGGPQCGVREALSGAVRGDEVLQDRQAFHEVGLDRALDDLALRVGHEAAHPGQLADLLERPASSGVGHHEDRVQLVEVVLHGLRDLLGGLVPPVRDRLLALLGGDVAVLVVGLDLLGLLLVPLQDLLLVGGRHDVVLRDRDPGLRRVVEPEVLERVEHLRHRGGAVRIDQVRDHLVDAVLLQVVVDELELVRVVLVTQSLLERALDLVVEDDPPDRRQEVLVAGAAVLRPIVQVHDAVLVRELGLLRRPERMRRLLELRRVDLVDVLVRVGQEVKAEHHVLRRRRQGLAVRGRQDVVRGQHQDAGLGLRLR